MTDLPIFYHNGSRMNGLGGGGMDSFDAMKKRRWIGYITILAVVVLFTFFRRAQGGNDYPLQPVDDGIILSGNGGEAVTALKYDRITDLELRSEFDPGTEAGEQGGSRKYHYGLYENEELGTYMFYRNDGNSRYIIVTSDDPALAYKHVVFNYGSETDTEEAFRAFGEAWRQYTGR